eukprot:GILK01028724.1.p2 GENE.GILK01028724.1~~GILK01028724.1.p2  ORF type:complete len:140 (+),score=9.31 GILK01028724.1:39-422(+)
MAQLCGRGGEWMSQHDCPKWIDSLKGFCSTMPYLKAVSDFSVSNYLIKKAKDPSMQTVKVHIAGGLNVRHPLLSTYTNPFSAYQLYISNAGATEEGLSSPQVPKSPGFWDGMRRPSSVHGFFSITFS